MESAIAERIQSSSIDVNLEIRIDDFQTTNESSKKGDYIEHSDSGLRAWFSATASPSGYNKETEGWLVIRPYVTVLQGKYRPQNSVISWTVSVIDIEGNARFPRSFMQDLSKDITDAKYLERSFILSRADEFLPEGVLTMHCDICFHCYNTTHSLDPENQSKVTELVVPDAPIGEREHVKNDDKSDNIDDHKDFVMKNKILTEVLYLAEKGKVCAIYDPPSTEGRHPKAWTFVTRPENFNVILDNRLDNIGARLLKFSPVIRQCVNAPMKERLEKRIELPDFDSQTFKNVVYFVTKETLPKFEFGVLLEIYKFSHMYGMEQLQRNCAEDITSSLEQERDFIELQKLADFFSDKYLSELLCAPREDKNLERELSHFKIDDGPYSDYYT